MASGPFWYKDGPNPLASVLMALMEHVFVVEISYNVLHKSDNIRFVLYCIIYGNLYYSSTCSYSVDLSRYRIV